MPGQPFDRQPPEAELLGALCRPTVVADAGVVEPAAGKAHDLCERAINWPYFLQLVEHHRIASLVVRGAALLAAPVPEDIQRRLRDRSVANAREAFRYLAELQRLLDLFSAEGVRATVLKGVPLSQMAFGDVGLREVGDIDLLIDPAEAERCDALLLGSGMVRQEPAAQLTPRRRDFYIRYFKDYTYHAGYGGFEVDLHWRLVRDAAAAQRILPVPTSGPGGPRESRQVLRIGSMEVEVLTFERCLLHLALHGAMDGWARWKALADVAALWARASEPQRATAWDLAGSTACTPYLRAALVLADEWLGPLPGLPVPDETKSPVRLSAYIVGNNRRRMRKDRFLSPPDGASSFAMKMHEARLYPSMRSRFELVARVLFRPRIWETVDLPDDLFFMYPLLSPAEWLFFRWKRSTTGKR